MRARVYRPTFSALALAAFGTALLHGPACVRAAGPAPAEANAVAATIDRLLEEHWRRAGITPASVAEDAVLFRRLTLDLVGRVPTPGEVEHLRATSPRDRYAAAVRRLLDGPEFAWYFATVLDGMIQGPFAGDPGFLRYLRAALRDGKPWDVLFREVMLGPWDTPERKPAVAFLARRAKDLDLLTADVARSFFGVDVSCARCHNHPLVKDWKREHYYGLAAFLVRTTGGKGGVAEKNEGEARFGGKGGKERVAPMMFLSGRTVDEPARPAGGARKARFSRRAELVRVALEDRKFLSRAIVNRVWEYLLGRGLVDPVDQIHSGNPASVPALLDALAADFAASGYDLRRLVTDIVLSRAYRLDTRRADPAPGPQHFAVARLRPLSPRQLAAALVVALGDGRFEPTAENLRAVEERAAGLIGRLDPRTREFQSSAGEALFLSNSEAVRQLVAAGGTNLTARLAAGAGDRERVRTAFAVLLSRPPTAAEFDRLVPWLGGQPDRRAACADLVWALLASAEFRFNH